MTVILTIRDPAEAQRLGDRGSALKQGQPVTQRAPAEMRGRHPGPGPDPTRLEGNNFSGNTQHPRPVQAIPVL